MGPVFLTAMQVYDSTHRQPINRLIKEAAAGTMKKTNHHETKTKSHTANFKNEVNYW
jgi:hypothetical protein